MEVILLERIEKLGAMGEIVTVKPGYARNYLLTQGKALRSSKANLAKFEAERAALEALSAEKRKDAEAEAAKLDGMKFVILRQASEAGNLFGSVAPRDLTDALSENGYTIDRRHIALDKPIKELGLHEIKVSLHPEVSVTVVANVARSQEEAELQAEGKSIAQIRAEEQAAEEAEFDVQSLFDEDADLSNLRGGADEGDRDGDDGEASDADGEADGDAETR